LDWSNERYVRLYTRDTKTWKLIGWKGQSVFAGLIRKVDRSGLLEDVFDGEDVSIILGNGIPIDIAQEGLDLLVHRGVIEITSAGVLIPNYLEAQEASMTDAQRQRECRARRRDMAKKSQNVTCESQNVSIPSQPVTGCHKQSQPVTPSLPTLTDPSYPNRSSKRKARARASYSVEFETFRSSYPRHRIGGKAQDWKSWQVAKAAGMTAEKAEKYLGFWKKSPKWERDNGSYIVALSRWLREGYWETTPANYEPRPETRAEAMRRRTVEALRQDQEDEKHGLFD
jgi:hypothetical protein